MNRCPTCGTTYPDDARFCTRDGTRAFSSRGFGGDRSPDAKAAPCRATTPESQRPDDRERRGVGTATLWTG